MTLAPEVVSLGMGYKAGRGGPVYPALCCILEKTTNKSPAARRVEKLQYKMYDAEVALRHAAEDFLASKEGRDHVLKAAEATMFDAVFDAEYAFQEALENFIVAEGCPEALEDVYERYCDARADWVEADELLASR